MTSWNFDLLVERQSINTLVKYTSKFSLDGLHKVHPTMQDHVDGEISQANLKKISMIVSPGLVRTRIKNVFDTVQMDYSEIKHGCITEIDGIQKRQKGRDFATTAVENLELLLRHQMRPMEKFSVTFFSPRHAYVLDDLDEYLSSRNNRLKVKNFTMETVDLTDFIKILPHLHTGFLKEINISKFVDEIPTVETWDLNHLAQLRQWKRAKELTTGGVLVKLNVTNFIHFKTVSISVPTTCARDLILIRHVALHNEKFETYFIGYGKLEDQDFLLEAFGPWFRQQYTPDGNKKVYYFTTPRSKIAVEITFFVDSYFHFVRMARSAASSKYLVVI